jgi:hypothetical protein
MTKRIFLILLIIIPGFTSLLSQETLRLIVGATDEPAEYTVTVTVVPEGAGKVSGEGTYNAGDEVTLEVVANEGYDFINWTDSAGYEISNDPVYTFTMPAEDVEVIANMDVINFTGMADWHPGPGIILFPNPATDGFVILSEERMNFIEIAGYNGRVVYNKEINSLETQISTGGFQGGIYIVRIHTDSGVYFKKVVIIR